MTFFCFFAARPIGRRLFTKRRFLLLFTCCLAVRGEVAGLRLGLRPRPQKKSIFAEKGLDAALFIN
jgi:hypothetical protein